MSHPQHNAEYRQRDEAEVHFQLRLRYLTYGNSFKGLVWDKRPTVLLQISVFTAFIHFSKSFLMYLHGKWGSVFFFLTLQ